MLMILVKFIQRIHGLQEEQREQSYCGDFYLKWRMWTFPPPLLWSCVCEVVWTSHSAAGDSSDSEPGICFSDRSGASLCEGKWTFTNSSSVINLGLHPASLHSPTHPHSSSQTSKRPSPIPAPPSPDLHDNGTSRCPGNRPFISCVIKKMYSPSLLRPLFHIFVFVVGPADKLQSRSQQILHQRPFCKSSSRWIPDESRGNRRTNEPMAAADNFIRSRPTESELKPNT